MIITHLSTELALSTKQSNPITGLDRPWGSQEAEAPRFQDIRHMKLVKLSALHTSCLYSPGKIHGTHSCYRLSQPQGHSAAGRIMSMKNSNDTIRNRTRDLPACSTVHYQLSIWKKKNPASLQAINIINLFSFDTAACVPVPVLLYEKGVAGITMYVCPQT